MKFTAIVAAAAVGSVQSQLVCDVLPGMVSLDTQDNECCGAAIALVSAGAIAGGMGGMLGGACLHMGNYAEFFPDGCTDCTPPGDAENIPSCTAGSSPTLTTMAAAQVALCCKEVEGGLCHRSIVAGAGTGAGAMNSQVVGGFDEDGDGDVDLCAEIECVSGPSFAPTASPPTNAPTPAPTLAPTTSKLVIVSLLVTAESSDGLCEAAEEAWAAVGATCEASEAEADRRRLATAWELLMTAQLPFDTEITAEILAVGAEAFVNSEAMVAVGGLLEVEGFVEVPTADLGEFGADPDAYVLSNGVGWTADQPERAATKSPTTSPTPAPTITVSGASTTSVSLFLGGVCAALGLVM
jgi:hypothetical protein